MNDTTKGAFNRSGGPPSAQPSPETPIRYVSRPVTRKQLEDLKKTLPQPKLKLELAPRGAVSKLVFDERYKRTFDVIQQIHHLLEARRGVAREAFERANENRTRRPGQKR